MGITKSTTLILNGGMAKRSKKNPVNEIVYRIFFVAPRVGLEPTTARLTAACSTDWAKEAYRRRQAPPKKCWRYLFFRPVSRQVSSAQVSLTSVFGMGTGGPSLQSTPTYFFLKEKASKKNSTLFSSKKKGCDSITTPSKPNKVTTARSASACIPFLALNLRLQVKPSAY